MTNTLTPKETADRLGVTTQSVRRYTDKLGRHLSPGATARPRQFTPEDVYILQTAAAWLSAGMTYADVDQRLDGLTLPESVTDIVLADSDNVAAPAVPAALEILTSMTSAIEALTARQADIDGIRSRVDELADRQTVQHTAHMRDVETMAERVRQQQSALDVKLATVQDQVSGRVPVRTAILFFLLGALVTAGIVAFVFLFLVQ